MCESFSVGPVHYIAHLGMPVLFVYDKHSPKNIFGEFNSTPAEKLDWLKEVNCHPSVLFERFSFTLTILDTHHPQSARDLHT